MLSDLELMANLDYYEGTYKSPTYDLRTMLLSSKASILEVCGWVEQAMDLFVMDTARRCGLSPARQEWISQKYVRPTSGFSYQGHFEKMIVSVVGYRVLEEAESKAGGVIPIMEGTLSDLTKLRNHYAHTHFNSIDPYPKNMTGIPAPTLLKSHAKTVVVGLKELETQMIHLNC